MNIYSVQVLKLVIMMKENNSMLVAVKNYAAILTISSSSFMKLTNYMVYLNACKQNQPENILLP